MSVFLSVVFFQSLCWRAFKKITCRPVKSNLLRHHWQRTHRQSHIICIKWPFMRCCAVKKLYSYLLTSPTQGTSDKVTQWLYLVDVSHFQKELSHSGNLRVQYSSTSTRRCEAKAFVYCILFESQSAGTLRMSNNFAAIYVVKVLDVKIRSERSSFCQRPTGDGIRECPLSSVKAGSE